MIRSLLACNRSVAFRGSNFQLNSLQKADKLTFERCCASLSASERSQEDSANLNDFLNRYQKMARIRPFDACRLIIKMAEHRKEPGSHSELYEKIKTDAEVSEPKILVKAVKALEQSQCEEVETKMIISALKSLHSLGVPNHMFMVKNLENALTWRCRTCNIKEMPVMLTFALKRRGYGETSEKFYQEVIQTLERRWVEIEDPELIGTLFRYSNLFKVKFIAKLEDRMIEKAEGMSTEAMIILLKTLAQSRRRTVPLIKALVFHLTRKTDLNDIKLVSDCLYASSNLAIKDPDFLESLCSKCEAIFLSLEATHLSDAVVRSIITSIGQLGIYHSRALNSISAWYSQRLQQEPPLGCKDLAAFVLTTGSINFVPDNSEPIFKAALEQLSSLSVGDSILWLNIVWSLAVLGKAEPRHFESVLTSDYVQNMTALEDPRTESCKQKLLNVNAAAMFLNKDYKGSTIDTVNNSIISSYKPSQSASRINLSKTVFDSFHALASPPNFLLKNINTQMGFLLDAEAVFEVATAKPIGPILDYSELGRLALSQDSLPSPVKEVPKGSKKVGVMILAFHDCPIGTYTHLSGAVSLQKKLLEARGYNVMFIRHDEFGQNRNKLQQVKLLESKLRNFLKQ